MPPTPDTPTPLDTPTPFSLVQDNDPQLLRQAEYKLSRKRRLSRVFTRSKRHSSIENRNGSTSPSSSTPSLLDESSVNSHKKGSHKTTVRAVQPLDLGPGITLDDSALADEDLHTDRYEWAIVYENQRGMTIFSIPYYSSLSLLPTDPSSFTLPNASLKRSKQAPISLENYPLPDGNWHWVSRCWMIDMRSDTGEVQHDGFEYNWMFRRTKWRAQIGSFNAGGWVRRRRWMRLMVCPAKAHVHTPKLGEDGTGASTHISASVSSSNAHGDLARKFNRLSFGSNFPPSVRTKATDRSASTASDWAHQIHPDEVWMGDCAGDWQRCRLLMRRVVRDGQKLELWKLWLGLYHPYNKEEDEIEGKGKGKDTNNRRAKQWTEDSGPMPSEVTFLERLDRDYVDLAPREYVSAVLREHGKHILSIFIFPESRVQFLKILGQARLLSEINVELGIGFESTEIDFWSYVSGLGSEPGAEELLQTSTSANMAKAKTVPPNLIAASPSLSRKKAGPLLEVPKA